MISLQPGSSRLTGIFESQDNLNLIEGKFQGIYFMKAPEALWYTLL